MTTANIVFLIDIQNGFARYDLTPEQGGSLYVPGSEHSGEASARLIRNASNTVFVLSQDFHPENHVSFMTSHPGVLTLRKNILRAQGFPEAELDTAVLSPLNLPFDDILLQQDVYGRFCAVACGVGHEWRAVSTDENGCITAILDYEIPTDVVLGALRQKLWSPHGIEGTESALFVPPIMDELPQNLVAALHTDNHSAVLKATDDRGNTFYVARKGTRPDLDSYGLATENDGLSKTKAPEVFKAIASQFKEKGVTRVKSFVGGLASNFCVEFSDTDIHNEFFPLLDLLKIDYEAFLLTDISAGIPIVVPSGAWPDLATTVKRMESKGKQSCSTDDVIRSTLSGSRSKHKRLEANA